MTYRMYAAIVAALGAATLVLPAQSAAARPATTTHTTSMTRAHPHAALRHHHRRIIGLSWWPGYGGDFYGPEGAAMAEVPPPSNDVHYTYKYDVPWDWAHRFPPNVVPSDRPYVPSCNSEAVNVPGRGGEQTVNIMRCY